MFFTCVSFFVAMILSRCCDFVLQGSVAKKPYNPILGETFRCFWVLPECEASRTEVSLNSNIFLRDPENKANGLVEKMLFVT